MNEPAWSYSSLTAYETCPYRYFLTRVTKEVKEPPTDATRHGVAVHLALELRLRDKTPLPAAYAAYEKYCVSIEKSGGTVCAEEQYALAGTLQRVDWFAKNVWVRSILDVSIFNGKNAAVLDWKTGKVKPESAQLKLSAAMIFHTHPEVQKVSSGFIWLKEDKITKETFTRENDLHLIWKEFLPRVKRLTLAVAESKWEKKPSGLCRNWCPVGKSKCQHCGI